MLCWSHVSIQVSFFIIEMSWGSKSSNVSNPIILHRWLIVIFVDLYNLCDCSSLLAIILNCSWCRLLQEAMTYNNFAKPEKKSSSKSWHWSEWLPSPCTCGDYRRRCRSGGPILVSITLSFLYNISWLGGKKKHASCIWAIPVNKTHV